jgi:putative MATE family efflux protein
VWRISLPILFAEISETVVHLIDTMFLARVGVIELGAVGIADSLLELFLVLPLGFVDGIQIVSARRLGQRRPTAVGRVFNRGFLVVLATGAALTVALKLLSPLLVGWFVRSEPVAVAVDDFLQIAAYGLVFTAGCFAYSALLVSLGRTRILVPATLLLAGTNIALDYLFIFGKLGCPALGMRGAAIGSVGAELVTFLFLTVYVARLGSGRYGIFRAWSVDRRTSGQLGGISAPIAVQGFLEASRWLGFFLILEHVSDQALAIGNIVYACYAVFGIPAEAFAETSCSMVSRFVGRDQGRRIGALLRNTTGGALMITLPFIIVACLFPGWVLAAFAPDSALLTESYATLRLVALAMLIVIPGEMWFAAVLGTGDTPASLGIELVLTLSMLAVAYFAAIHLGWRVELVWLSLPISWSIGLLISYGWIQSGFWRRREI